MKNKPSKLFGAPIRTVPNGAHIVHATKIKTPTHATPMAGPIPAMNSMIPGNNQANVIPLNNQPN